MAAPQIPETQWAQVIEKNGGRTSSPLFTISIEHSHLPVAFKTQFPNGVCQSHSQTHPLVPNPHRS